MNTRIMHLTALVATIAAFAPSAYASELIANGDFESGNAGWTFSGNTINTTYASFYHSPTHYLWFGDDNGTDTAYQDVFIPNNAVTATLSFYYNINTSQTSGTPDTFSATIADTSGNLLNTVGNWSNLNGVSPGAYTQKTFDLIAYKGKTIRIYFASVCTLNGTKTTNFRIDDVSVEITTASLPTISSPTADQITATSARLNASVNPNGSDTTGHFDYGLTTAYGSHTTTIDYGSGTSATSASATVNSLTPNTLYHYRFVAANVAGTQNGTDASFTTSSCSYSLDHNTANPSNNSGSGNFNVTTTSGCSWSASSDVTWLHSTSSGSGNGVVSYTYDVNPNNFSRAGHIMVGDQSFTVTQAANPNSSSPLAGKGEWIWKLNNAIAATPGAVTVQDVINYEASIGVKYLIVKAGEGNHYYPSSDPKLDSAFVNACHNAGLKVFGYHYVYGGAYQGRVLPNGQPNGSYWNENSSVSGSVSEISVANQILDTGCDGLIIDAESAYEDLVSATITPGNGDPTRFYYLGGTYPPDPSATPAPVPQTAAAAAQEYCTGILTAHPGAFLAYAPFYNPAGHPNFPYVAFGKYCAAAMPQAYYRGNKLTPETTLSRMDSQWAQLQSYWSTSGHADSVKPVFPIGYSISPATSADIVDFVNLLNNDSSAVTPGGYQGVSFWNVDYQTSDMWSGIASITIAPTPSSDNTAPTISSFSVTPNSITIGSAFIATYSVSDSGGSGLKQVVLRRTSGDGSAYDPGWQDIQTVAVTGNGPVSGSFSPDIPPDLQTYHYGMAVFDNANNSTDERQAGLGPLSRSVVAGTIASTTPTPASGTSATVGQSFPLSVSVSCSLAVAGYLQVWVYDSGFATSVKNGVANSSPQSGPVQINLTLPSNPAGSHDYTIYAQFRPGATSGPILNDGINDVILSSSYTLNWQIVIPSTPSASPPSTVTSSGFTATWNSSPGASGYQIDVSADSGFSTFVSGYQDLDVQNSLSWPVNGLTPGETYYYRVRAYNGSGTSDSSTAISVTTAVDGSTSPIIGNPTLTGTTFSVLIPTIVGSNYTLEYKISLSDSVWTPVQTIDGTGGTNELTDTDATNVSRLYRIHVH